MSERAGVLAPESFVRPPDTTGNSVDRRVETVFTEDMTQNPTTESHPYQVGRVVYTTLDEAITKAQAAQDAYPDWKAHVIDRRTMTQAWPTPEARSHTTHVNHLPHLGKWEAYCDLCGRIGVSHDNLGDAAAIADRHAEIGGFG